MVELTARVTMQAAAEDLPWRIDLSEAVELFAGVEFTVEPVR